MNLANKITLSRILIMPVFMISLEMTGSTWKIIALICFFYASFSDWLDGVVARKNNWVTDFGKFMDPLADKIFISAAFIAFVSMENLKIPAWMVTIILSREFLITGLRTIAISKGIVLPAQKSGKFKTTFQLISIFIIIMVSLYYDLEKTGVFLVSSPIRNVLESLPLIFMWMVVFFTLVSGFSFIYKNRKILEQ